MSVEVIAEPGVTHEGHHDRILQLIDAAAEAGANVFKPGWTSNPEKFAARRRVPDKYLRYYQWLAFPFDWHQEFSARCHELGMLYAVTVVLPEDVAPLRQLQDGDRDAVDLLKITSFESLSRDLLDATEAAGGRLIISTGMLDAEQVAWLDAWRKRGNNTSRRVDLLHCVSAYPAKLEEMNLRVLEQPWCDGLSDHSRNVNTGSMAVALGARILEVHMRLDDCSEENPDFAAALPPDELRDYIQWARDPLGGATADVLGDGVKRPMPSEQAMSQYRVTS